MAKNRRKQKKIEEVKEQIKKVDPVQELEREEAEIIAEQEAEDLAAEFDDEQDSHDEHGEYDGSDEIRELEEVDEQLEPENDAEEDDDVAGAEKISLREKVRKKRLAKKEALKKQHKWTMPIWLRVSASILLLAGLSIVFTWFILWRSNLCDAEATNTFIGEKPRLFAYSCMIIFAIMASLAAITWRPFLSIGISFAAFSILSYIQMEKYRLRGIPLLPEDFLLAGNAGEVAQFADQDSIMRLAFGAAFIIVGSALLEHCARRVIGRNTHRGSCWKRYSIIPRVTFSLVALAMLSMVVTPFLQRKNYGWIKDEVSLVEWNQNENYNSNGFIIGFLFNLGQMEVEQPSDYSEARMREIAEKYQAIRAADTDRIPLTEVADNVVVILDETFYDPALLTKYYSHTGGDVTPNLHRIFRNYPSGYMYSPEYGGGTANVEFAVLTGLSTYWATGVVPYVNVVPKLGSRMSAASWAKDYGFDTTAIHAFDGSMYKRNLAYARFGIDTFIDQETMKYTEHDSKSAYINDESVFKEVLDLLEDGEESQMVLAVTMMNHASYDTAQYPEIDFRLRGGESNYLLEASFQSIHNADEYLGEFLDELDDLDERTVVLWFGDHAAGVLDKYYKSDDKNDRDIAHLTPYFIYANFDIESLWTVKETAKINEELGFEYPTRGVNLPTTTPNCLLNTMYNILGVEKPALFYLVDTICEETPILMKGYFAGNPPEETEALREYQLVNYDVLAGKHYWDGE